MKTVRRPPYPKWNPGYFPCSSLTPLPLSSRRPSVSFGGFGLRELSFGAPKLVESQTLLRDACLEVWTEFESMDRLIRAFELSRPLAVLHQAMIYHQTVIPQTAAKWESQNMVPYFLRELV